MARTASSSTRLALVERAAEMLARREPVTVRELTQRVGTSTMAVYTHFGGLDGLWRAVRQEGFVRLSERLARVTPTADPVRDLAAYGAAYVEHALSEPFLYRTMFDTAADLEDPEAAGASFGLLVSSAGRAREAGRFAASRDPQAVATEYWAAGHGLVMLALTGVLPGAAVGAHARSLARAVFVAAGDDPELCARSVRRGWPAR